MGQNCCGGEKDKQNQNFDAQDPKSSGIMANKKQPVIDNAHLGAGAKGANLTSEQALAALQLGEKCIMSVIRL